MTVTIRTTGANWQHEVNNDNPEVAVRHTWRAIEGGTPLEMRMAPGGDSTPRWIVLNPAHVIHVYADA